MFLCLVILVDFGVYELGGMATSQHDEIVLYMVLLYIDCVPVAFDWLAEVPKLKCAWTGVASGLSKQRTPWQDSWSGCKPGCHRMLCAEVPWGSDRSQHRLQVPRALRASAGVSQKVPEHPAPWGAKANHLKLKWYRKCSRVLCTCSTSVQQLELSADRGAHSRAALWDARAGRARDPGLSEVAVQLRCLDPAPILSIKVEGEVNCVVTSLSNLESFSSFPIVCQGSRACPFSF